MNSDNNDISVDIDDNIIVDIDPLLRALASRADPNNSDALINFKQFADAAETIHGEPPFGAKGSTKRQQCRTLYDTYRLRAKRGLTDLEVPSNWSYWDVLNKTDKLVCLLNKPSSFSSPNQKKRRLRSLSPKQTKKITTPTRKTTNKIITPAHTTMTDASKGGSEYEAYYQRLLNDNTIHAVSLSNSLDNHGFVAYEQKNVKVGTGVYTTKVGMLFPLTSVAEATYANPRLREDGHGIDIFQANIHPIVGGKVGGSSNLLEDNLDRVLGKDEARDVAVDLMLGSKKEGVVRHHVESGGVTISDVPFEKHSYMLPPGIDTENRYFNPNKPANDDFHLDRKLVVLTDLNTRNFMDITDKLRDTAPTIVAVDACMTDDTKANLYKQANKLFLQTQLKVNTVVYFYIQFSVFGEDAAGRQAKAPDLALTDLFDGLDFAG